jgi:A118 family predicted phage portal protein
MNKAILEQVRKIKNGTTPVNLNNFEVYREYYEGDVKDFHNYTMQINNTMKAFRRKTMNLPKTLTELMNELIVSGDIEVNTDKEAKNEVFNNVLKKNTFNSSLIKIYEQVLLHGYGAIDVTGVGEDVKIRFYNASEFVVLTNDNDNITRASFVYQYAKEKTFDNLVTTYSKRDDIWEVETELFKSGEVSALGTKCGDDVLMGEYGINALQTIEHKPFFVLKTPLVDAMCPESPLGGSIIAKSLDKFKALDEAFDSLSNEMSLGRKRIFVNTRLMSKTEVETSSGKMKEMQLFDTGLGVYQSFNGTDQNDAIIESNMTLRVTEHKEAININLSLICKDLNVDQSVLSFEDGAMKYTTATEVNSTLRKTLAVKNKFRLSFNDTMEEFFSFLNYAIYGIYEQIEYIINENEIEDAQDQHDKTTQLFQLGVIGRRRALKEYGYTEEEIEEIIQELDVENFVDGAISDPIDEPTD